MSDCFIDHCFTYCVWKIKIPRSPPKYIEVRQYKKMNSDLFLYDLINIYWDRFQLIPYADDAWDFFCCEVANVINKHAPMRTIRVKGLHLPWINSDLISIFKDRDMAWTKYRSSKQSNDWEVYRFLRNQCKTKSRNAKSNFYNDNFSQDFHNPLHFWSHLNNILNKGSKSSINQLHINNSTISDPSLTSNAFNEHFSSVSRTLHTTPYTMADHVIPPALNSLFSFRKSMPLDIYNAICEMKENYRAGPDGLEPEFVKLAAHILKYPLADLFNLSLFTHCIPSV